MDGNNVGAGTIQAYFQSWPCTQHSSLQGTYQKGSGEVDDWHNGVLRCLALTQAAEGYQHGAGVQSGKRKRQQCCGQDNRVRQQPSQDMKSRALSAVRLLS